MEETDKLLQILIGSVMTQAALCRFLIEEKAVDRDRLLAFLERKGKDWGKTASDEALTPLAMLLTALTPTEEPDFPTTVH